MSRARILADYVSSGDELADKAPLASPTFTGTATFSGDIVPSTPLTNRNMIINGGFDVWQRGTSISTSHGFNADRWHSSHGAVLTSSRQTFTVGQTDVPNNPKYYQRTNGAGLSSGESFEIRYHIEGVERGANQQVTLSFYAKSSVGATHISRFWQRFNGWTDFQSGEGGSNFTTTTSWQRFERTFTLADITGETVVDGNNSLTLSIDGETGFSGTFDLSNVQLELGSSATPFEHLGYGDELARCQRYYEYRPDTYQNQVHGSTSGRGSLTMDWAVEKRADPTVTFKDGAGTVGKVTYHSANLGNGANHNLGLYYWSQFHTHCLFVTDSYSGYDFYINTIIADAEL
jgi:hypothetical protein